MFFGDLHLDQILAALANGREEYDLAPFFYRPVARCRGGRITAITC